MEKESNLKEENKEKNDLESVEKESIDKSLEKKSNWFLISILVIAVGIFVGIWIVSESKKYDYVGLTFKKENFGEIPLHTAQLTGNSINGAPIDFKLNLRNDPRKNKIPSDRVNLIAGKPVYFSINMDSNIDKCGSVPLVSLGQFMSGMGFQIITGVTTPEKAEELNKPQIICDDITDSSVIIITEGDESKIQKLSKTCYVLSVNNCELTDVVEKFELSIISEMNNKPLN